MGAVVWEAEGKLRANTKQRAILRRISELRIYTSMCMCIFGERACCTPCWYHCRCGASAEHSRLLLDFSWCFCEGVLSGQAGGASLLDHCYVFLKVPFFLTVAWLVAPAILIEDNLYFATGCTGRWWSHCSLRCSKKRVDVAVRDIL